MLSIYLTPFFTVYCCALALVLGAVMGSFLNCTAYRVARGTPFVKGRSACPTCGHALGVLDLVPVLSWAVLRGRCRHCKAPISVRYPLTELIFSLLTLACLLCFDLSVVGLRNWIFTACLFCLSLVDLDSMIIPDECLLISAAAWVVTLPFVAMSRQEILLSIVAGLVCGGFMLGLSLVMDNLLKRESMGGGDIKLLAVSGLYLGAVGMLFGLMLSCVLGLVFGWARKRMSKHPESEAFPFAPAISAAVWLMLLYGAPLVEWYVGLLS